MNQNDLSAGTNFSKWFKIYCWIKPKRNQIYMHLTLKTATDQNYLICRDAFCSIYHNLKFSNYLQIFPHTADLRFAQRSGKISCRPRSNTILEIYTWLYQVTIESANNCAICIISTFHKDNQQYTAKKQQTLLLCLTLLSGRTLVQNLFDHLEESFFF